MTIVHLHLDGDITQNHQVTLRTLNKSLSHLQNAIDRAYLSEVRGDLWKYARMTASEIEECSLWVQEPEEGGYILNFLSSTPLVRDAVKKVSEVIDGVVNDFAAQGINRAEDLVQSHSDRIAQYHAKVVTPKRLSTIIQQGESLGVRSYTSRAIAREINEMLGLIRTERAGDSTIELQLAGSRTGPHVFTRADADSFARVVRAKTLSSPIIYRGVPRTLDNEALTGKIFNTETNKLSIVHFYNQEIFNSILPSFGSKTEIEFVGASLVEYGAFDPYAGNIYFIALV